MRHYRATNLATSEVVEYDAELPQAEHLGLGWTLQELFFAEASPDDPPPPPPSFVKITKLAFRNRFTQTEKVAVEIAALDVPTASLQARSMAAALRASQQDVQVAEHIDLMRVDTRAGVLQLEAAGLLAAGRAAVILDTAPTDAEVFNG